MALRYSGPAVFRSPVGTWSVEADLRTDVSGGVYSWGGRLHAADLGALAAQARGGTLSLPDCGDSEVHVTVADLDPERGGVLLRVNGHDRAPYETPEDRIVIEQHAEEAR